MCGELLPSRLVPQFVHFAFRMRVILKEIKKEVGDAKMRADARVGKKKERGREREKERGEKERERER